MISVEEARRMIMAKVSLGAVGNLSMSDAAGAYTAADVVAPYEHPLFDMSAVDGYAFQFDTEVERWMISGTVAAGASLALGLKKGECVRIFTGAMLPVGSDTVVMQEFVNVDDGSITHRDMRLVRGSNVRRRADQVKRGEAILAKGTRISPAVIGLLASVGVEAIPVVLRPEVAVLVTGDEFIRDRKFVQGRIFSSNDHTLNAALRADGIPSVISHVADDIKALDDAIAQAAELNDVIITTGGASVGDHDLIHDAVVRAGGTIHFHGVAQKPGKPMLFATIHGKPFFGLPGNPRAVLVLFYEYVLPFLRAMQGAVAPFLPSEYLPTATAIQLKGDRAEFRAARVRGGRVEMLGDEGSHMLRTLVEANAIVQLAADRRTWSTGDPVEVHYLPQACF